MFSMQTILKLFESKLLAKVCAMPKA